MVFIKELSTARFSQPGRLTEVIRKLCNVANLPREGELKAFIDLRPETPMALCVSVYKGQIYAVDNRCPHQRAPLAAGKLEDDAIVCPIHGWKWRVTTGEPFHPSDPPIATYQVRQYGDEAFVRIPETASVCPTGKALDAASPIKTSCALQPFSAIR